MSEDAANYGIKIGKECMGTDGHKRTAQLVEYHYGNVQVKAYNSFWGKVEWLPMQEWDKLNP